MRRNSGIIGDSKTVNAEMSTVGGVHDTYDGYNYRIVDVWPYTQKIIGYSLSPGTTISEGSSLSIDCITSGFLDGELAYYSINTVSGPTMTDADFVDGLTGSFEVTGNTGSAIITANAGDGSENNSFTVTVRKSSIYGDIFFTTETITVTDVADVVGQVNFLTPGTHYWTCPAGVQKVHVVAIGGGGGGIAYSCCGYGMMGGAGGGLGWKNDISVTAGNTYTVVVGAGGIGGRYSNGSESGQDSYFISADTVKGGGGRYGRYAQATPDSSFYGDGGGKGGGSHYQASSGSGPGGGGGAGGYSGNGGKGRHTVYSAAYAGSGGAGGGNAGSGDSTYVRAYSGGGVGIYGEGASGDQYGGGGSGGTDGTVDGPGNYGGGGGGSTNGYEDSKDGAGGAVRIIWGSSRAYPSTLTTDQ